MAKPPEFILTPNVRDMTPGERKIMDKFAQAHKEQIAHLTEAGDPVPRTACPICGKPITKVHDPKEGPWDCWHCKTQLYVDDERLVNCRDLPMTIGEKAKRALGIIPSTNGIVKPTPDYRYRLDYLLGFVIWRSPLHTAEMKRKGHHWFHDGGFMWTMRDLRGRKIKHQINMQDDSWYEPIIQSGRQISITQWIGEYIFGHVRSEQTAPTLAGINITHLPVEHQPEPMDIGLAFWLAPDYGTEDQVNPKNPAYAPFWMRDPAIQALPATRNGGLEHHDHTGFLGNVPIEKPAPAAKPLPDDFDAFLASDHKTYEEWLAEPETDDFLPLPPKMPDPFDNKINFSGEFSVPVTFGKVILDPNKKIEGKPYPPRSWER